MNSEIKKSIRLYHTNFLSNRFRYFFVIELVFWIILGYFLQFQRSPSLEDVGVIIKDHENSILMLIKILLPVIIYILLLIFTQSSIYNFLNHDKATFIYKMIPHSFQRFKQNLIGTYVIVCISLPVFCLAYILMFYPTYFVLATFTFSIMLLMSGLIVNISLYKASNFLLWDVFSVWLIVIMIMLCIVFNEHFYAYRLALTVVSIIVYILSILITFKILNNTLKHMKEVWLQ